MINLDRSEAYEEGTEVKRRGRKEARVKWHEAKRKRHEKKEASSTQASKN